MAIERQIRRFEEKNAELQTQQRVRYVQARFDKILDNTYNIVTLKKNLWHMVHDDALLHLTDGRELTREETVFHRKRLADAERKLRQLNDQGYEDRVENMHTYRHHAELKKAARSERAKELRDRNAQSVLSKVRNIIFEEDKLDDENWQQTLCGLFDDMDLNVVGAAAAASDEATGAVAAEVVDVTEVSALEQYMEQRRLDEIRHAALIENLLRPTDVDAMRTELGHLNDRIDTLYSQLCFSCGVCHQDHTYGLQDPYKTGCPDYIQWYEMNRRRGIDLNDVRAQLTAARQSKNVLMAQIAGSERGGVDHRRITRIRRMVRLGVPTEEIIERERRNALRLLNSSSTTEEMRDRVTRYLAMLDGNS